MLPPPPWTVCILFLLGIAVPPVVGVGVPAARMVPDSALVNVFLLGVAKMSSFRPPIDDRGFAAGEINSGAGICDCPPPAVLAREEGRLTLCPPVEKESLEDVDARDDGREEGWPFIASAI